MLVLVNFGWIRPGRVAGMGCPDPRAWPALRDLGLSTVVCLTEEPVPGRPEEHGFTVLHVPVRDFTTPRDEDLDRSVAWMRRALARGGAVVVHCTAGLGRTGTVLAAWLVSEGLDADAAIEEVRRLRPGSVETPAQADAVRRYAFRAR